MRLDVFNDFLQVGPTAGALGTGQDGLLDEIKIAVRDHHELVDQLGVSSS